MNRRVVALVAFLLTAALLGVSLGWLGSGGLFQIAMTAGVGEA